MSSGSTLKILSEYLDTPVLVKLKGGRSVKGTLKSFDQHLNLILRDAEELDGDGNSRPVGTVLIRGDNVIMMSPAK